MNTERKGKTILIIDDDELFCDVVSDFLKTSMKVLKAHTGEEGMAACAGERVDVVLLDQNLPDVEGHTLCPTILNYNDRTKIIFITAHPSFETAVNAIRSGAHDYLSKPFELEALNHSIANALKTIDLENVAQIAQYKSGKDSEDITLVGGGREMAGIKQLLVLASSSCAPVLITGETGTGKNMAAKAIHYGSKARDRAFINVNCAALPESLIESELFGYEKGAFTSAVSSRRGLFEMAEGGTLFLDEIGEMPVHLQTKLLSAIEDKKIKRLGGETIRPVDVRIIAATSSDMENNLGKTFRNDLYYRLSVIRIHMPPLRERPDDIPAICAHILQKITNSSNTRLAPEEEHRLMRYDWPGNVRELGNILERAVLVQKGTGIKPSELLAKAGERTQPPDASPETSYITDKDRIITLAELERIHIKAAMEKLSGNLAQTARHLGISLSTLKRKLKEYGLK
ncbi:MAG: sigma-54-dependent Fis family transcriptional regulator [Nitrospirae bacterium]|nr:MAG: sigma-54-dependent Fis family transcriptional regulator [Nitrospirota bacterium]